jgi:hypothetical protein
VPAPSIERLDGDALRLLAEVTGVSAGDQAFDFFSASPQALRLALAAPESESLMHPGHDLNELEIAIAVHRCAATICSAAWTMNDSTPVDLDLIGFAGQGVLLRSMVDLLAAALRSSWGPSWDAAPIDPPVSTGAARPGSLERLEELVTLCSSVGEIERGGALRLLADEALLSVGALSGRASKVPVTEDIWEQLEAVTPRAIRTMRPTLQPFNSLLDVHLLMGPVWFRMASQNLLFLELRPLLSALAAHFDTARRFLVQVVQGPLALKVDQVFSTTR